jgi:hypothetical protein
MDLYGDDMDIFSPEVRILGVDTRERKRNRLGELLRIIIANLDTRPIEYSPSEGVSIFETDLHGDLNVFLYTLLRAGLAKFNGQNPIGIIFYDPSDGNEYTLDTLLKWSRENDGLEKVPQKLMQRLQLLPDLKPTGIYSRYINCGDLVDAGGQSLQLIHLVTLLNKRCRDNGISAPKILLGNHENFYTLDYKSALRVAKEHRNTQLVSSLGYSFNYANSESTENKNAVEFTRQKFEQLKEPIVKAIENGIITMAHSIGNTIFSHAIITRGMVESSLDILKKLNSISDSEICSKYGEEMRERIVKLYEELVYLKREIDGSGKFDETKISRFVNALNEFNKIRLEIMVKMNVGGDSYNENPYLPGEAEIVEIMRSTGGSRGKMLLQRCRETKENDLIPNVKYIVGHDYSVDHSYSIGFGGKVLYADTSRSSSYNDHNFSYSDFSLVSNEFLRGSSRLELPLEMEGPSILDGSLRVVNISETITPGDLERKMKTNLEKIEKYLTYIL